MWGQVFKPVSYGVSSRIIPTRVGTRTARYHLCERAQDHPHACGDKKPVQVELRSYQGSSPRVWGQVKDEVLTAQGAGIIPTRVGTRSEQNAVKVLRWDHPHACGDKKKIIDTLDKELGSSPRVWGQVKPNINFTKLRGIIPTRVGTRVRLPTSYFRF